MIKRILLLTAFFGLVAWSAQAASPTVEAAIKSLAKIESDAAKFQTFCRITKALAEVGEDATKSEALDKELEDLLKTIGSDVYHAWDMVSDLDPNSEDGKAFETVLDALENKCGD